MKLNKNESVALSDVWGFKEAKYWWRPKTMKKLAAMGLVEPHPDEPRAWRITALGEQIYDELP